MLILLFKVLFEKAVNASKLCLKSFKYFEALFVVIPHNVGSQRSISQHMSLPHDSNQGVNC